nr:hypothetical protein [Tanacetum cinerariifolium]
MVLLGSEPVPEEEAKEESILREISSSYHEKNEWNSLEGDHTKQYHDASRNMEKGINEGRLRRPHFVSYVELFPRIYQYVDWIVTR